MSTIAGKSRRLLREYSLRVYSNDFDGRITFIKLGMTVHDLLVHLHRARILGPVRIGAERHILPLFLLGHKAQWTHFELFILIKVYLSFRRKDIFSGLRISSIDTLKRKENYLGPVDLV